MESLYAVFGGMSFYLTYHCQGWMDGWMVVYYIGGCVFVVRWLVCSRIGLDWIGSDGYVQ